MDATKYSNEELSSLMARCENEWLLMGTTAYSDLYLYNTVFQENYSRSLHLWFENGEARTGEYQPSWLESEDSAVDTDSFFECFSGVGIYRCTYGQYVVFFGQTLITASGMNDRKVQKGEPNKTKPDSIYIETILTRDSDEAIKYFVSRLKQADVEKSRSYYVALSGGGNIYNRTGGSLKVKDIDVKANYNDDLPLDKINEILNRDKSDLILFYGVPGAGKTTLIRYLMQTVKKKFIIMEPELIDSTSNKALLDYFTSNSDSIIVLEDCEKLLASRDESGNKTLGMLLNLTDGIIGEMFRVKFICTFNCELNKIDKALLRKGRLSLKYELKELALDKVKKIYPDATEPMTLADAYYATEENDFSKEDKKKIGF